MGGFNWMPVEDEALKDFVKEHKGDALAPLGVHAWADLAERWKALGKVKGFQTDRYANTMYERHHYLRRMAGRTDSAPVYHKNEWSAEEVKKLLAYVKERKGDEMAECTAAGFKDLEKAWQKPKGAPQGATSQGPTIASKPCPTCMGKHKAHTCGYVRKMRKKTRAKSNGRSAVGMYKKHLALRKKLGNFQSTKAFQASTPSSMTSATAPAPSLSGSGGGRKGFIMRKKQAEQSEQSATIQPSTASSTTSASPDGSNFGRWSDLEQAQFLEGLERYGKHWKQLSDHIKTRSVVQVRSHAQKFFNNLLKDHGPRANAKKPPSPSASAAPPPKHTN